METLLVQPPVYPIVAQHEFYAIPGLAITDVFNKFVKFEIRVAAALFIDSLLAGVVGCDRHRCVAFVKIEELAQIRRSRVDVKLRVHE